MELSTEEYNEVIKIAELEYSRTKKLGCEAWAENSGWSSLFKAPTAEQLQQKTCCHLLILRKNHFNPEKIKRKRKCFQKATIDYKIDKDGDLVLYLWS